MNIYGQSISDLQRYFTEAGIKSGAAKAKLLYRYVYLGERLPFNKELADKIAKDFDFSLLQIADKKESEDTCKILFSLSDNCKIETVIMKHKYGHSLCVSSQVGCNMGCAFCESGAHKKQRDLDVHEMVLQLVTAEREMGIKVKNVVIMGIGEPFDNYDNVMKFIDIITDHFGLAIGLSHITVSTCGLIPRINDFKERSTHCNLAVSLHAPCNEIRNKLMPINKVYDIHCLIDTVKEYSEAVNKRVSFEYVMISGVNDGADNAHKLAELVDGMNCYINLIPYNRTKSAYTGSQREDILAFYDVLKKYKLNVTIRMEFGADLKAACGQLRSEYVESTVVGLRI